MLFEALPKSVEVRFDTSIEHIADQSSRVEIELRDGSHEMAEVLVGADGIH